MLIFFFLASWSKCRWNPNPDIDLIALKAGRWELKLYDPVKFSIREELNHENNCTFNILWVIQALLVLLSLDWHPEGNLLAIGGSEEIVSIYDIRASSDKASVKMINKPFKGKST